MTDENSLASQFEALRPHLCRVAYGMLGSLAEAEDAVQETWLRLARTDAGPVDNLTGWLTTVTARISLDMLRARAARREEAVDLTTVVSAAAPHDDPMRERELADSIGIALLVVLQALEPAERIAFVLHDMFDMPFDQISPIVGRSTDATRQLASRARRRVRGAPKDSKVGVEHAIVDAFLAAARESDFERLLTVLDPNIVLHSDDGAVKLGGERTMRGAHAVAKAFMGRAQAARAALIDGALGVLVAPGGRLLLVLRVTIVNDRITAIEAVADRNRLNTVEFALL